MKKILCAWMALLLLAAVSFPALAEENLIKNGDFSEMEGDLPAHWRKEMWETDPGISILTVEADGYEGNSLSVVNVDPNDARFVQTVEVEPNTLYRITGMVWASDCESGGYGATLSIGNTFVYSESLYDTEDYYDYVTLYGKTGPSQRTLDVYCRVGGYGSEERGRAMFDNIEMVKLDERPADGMVYDFFREDSNNAQPKATTNPGEPERFTEAWLLFTFVYVCLAAGAIRKRGRACVEAGREDRSGKMIWLLLGVALLVRLIVALRVPGYHTDINCFSGWSDRIFSVGLTRFYSPDYFCDYPPGYMLLLWPVALIRRALGLLLNTALYRMFLKLLPMLADVAGAYLLWRTAKKRMSPRLALLLAGLYAFNPAAICNSAAWGQIDALLTLLIALCALSAAEDRYFKALLWFAAALLVKPQALLFAPLGLVAMLTGIVMAPDAETRARHLKGFLLGALACVGILYAVALLFCARQATGFADLLARPVTWMIELYSGTMQGYRFMTINTLNLHCLLGLNWARMEAHPVAERVAWALFALSYVYTAALCIISHKKPRRLLLLGATLIMLVCAFGPMMHERYVFPAMLLLALAFAMDRDVRLLVGLIALTATLFLNETLVLQGGMTEANFGHLQEAESWLNGPLSLVVVLNALFMAWVSFDICARGHVTALRAVQSEAVPAGQYTLSEPSRYKLNLRRVDYLLMAAVTLAYSVVAFVNLGDVKAPQRGWLSERSGESAVFDLGQVETFRMTYFGGICNSTFTVQISDDGEHWSPEVFARYNQGEIFRWLWFVPLDEEMATLYEGALDESPDAAQWTLATARDGNPRQTARYVRITAESAGLNLLELGFLDMENRPLPVTVASADRPGEAAKLIDEQDTVAAYPSYLNSTYFDEIYHARTAYEHLHGLNTYEWTHPPLGKVWMMLGIKIFGMTPFGWRFMGTLAGVMMLPVMYLLVKQLTGQTRLSMIAMCLLALDSMHFTQTRIATIDSYAVFWIMLTYLFMFRYCRMSWNREPLKKTLVPLGLCGVTMGMACATKWIGIYAAAGLAVLFFWTMAVRLRESRYIEGENPTRRNLVVTLLCCVVFFIVVPVLIYYFSYYWYLKAEGLTGFFGMFSKRWVERVIQIQKNIYGYHSGLGGDTHFFRSPWYQWPVIWWPMWYYSGTAYMPPGTISSISCMGNPAVWWFGLAALIFVFVRACYDRRASRRYVMVVIGFASQFLPWVLVPRSTFIYHYFASVPFIIIASVLMLDAVRRRSPKVFDVAACVLLASAAALFVMFYPLESGLPCARAYAQHLRWFKWYNY